MTVGADGLEPEVSPTSPVVDASSNSPAQPVDTGENQTPPATTTTSTPPLEDSTKDPRPRDQFGRFVEKAPDAGPDPVEEAIARLAKPTTSLPAKEPAKAADPAKSAPQQAAIEKPTTPDPKAASPDALKTDPFAEYDDREKAAIRDKTRNRIQTLHQRWQDSEAERQKVAPLVDAGKEYTELLDSYGVREDVGMVPLDQMAGLIRVQAAVNRADEALRSGRQPSASDLQALEAMTENINRVRQQFGLRPTAAPAPAALQPFQGELPPDLRDLVEVYGLDEKRVRLLAAAEARPTAPPVVDTPPPAAPQAPPVSAPDPIEAAYTGRLQREILATGVSDPNHYSTLLGHAKQKIMREFGVAEQQVPSLFNQMSARDRYEMLIGIHRSLTAKPSVPVPPPIKLPPATTQRSVSGAPPRQAANSGDAVDAAIARLARPG